MPGTPKGIDRRLGRRVKRKKKIIVYGVVLLLVLAALLLFTNVYILFLAPLEVGEEIDKGFGDVILVLGGGLKQGFQIGFSTQERLALAAALYRQKKRTIVISGGSLYPGSPAIKKMAAYLVNQGVAQADIRTEGKSQTTYDNFLHANELLKSSGFEEVVVCTSPYHQRRSRLIISHLELKNYKIAKMTDSEIYRPGTIKQRLRNIRLILREHIAILKFKIFKK